jgi:hypothetical protein
MEFWVCAYDENCKHISNNAEKMRRHQQSAHTTSSSYRYAHCKKSTAVDVEDKDEDSESRECEVRIDETNIDSKECEANNEENEERNADIEEIVVRFLVHGHCKALFSRRVYNDTCINDIANDVHTTLFAKDVEAKRNSLFPIEGEAQQFAGALESMKHILLIALLGWNK